MAQGDAYPEVTNEDYVPPALTVGAASSSHAAAMPFKGKTTGPKPSEYTGQYSVPTPKSIVPVATKKRIGRITIAQARRSCKAMLMSDNIPKVEQFQELQPPETLVSQNAEAERAIVDLMTDLEDTAHQLYEKVGTPRGRKEG